MMTFSPFVEILRFAFEVATISFFYYLMTTNYSDLIHHPGSSESVLRFAVVGFWFILGVVMVEFCRRENDSNKKDDLIVEKDDLIVELQAKISKKDEEMQAEISTKDTTISKLDEVISKKDTKISKLERELQDWEVQLKIENYPLWRKMKKRQAEKLGEEHLPSSYH